MKKIILLLLFIIISCETAQERAKIANSEINHIEKGNYGEKLPPDFDYEEFFKKESKSPSVKTDFVTPVFKDPDTLQYRNIQKPYKGFYGDYYNPYGSSSSYESSVEYRQSERKYGYAIIGEINAKNAMGGYNGYEKYCLIVRNKKAISFSSAYFCYSPDEAVKTLKKGMAKDK